MFSFMRIAAIDNNYQRLYRVLCMSSILVIGERMLLFFLSCLLYVCILHAYLGGLLLMINRG